MLDSLRKVLNLIPNPCIEFGRKHATNGGVAQPSCVSNLKLRVLTRTSYCLDFLGYPQFPPVNGTERRSWPDVGYHPARGCFRLAFGLATRPILLSAGAGRPPLASPSSACFLRNSATSSSSTATVIDRSATFVKSERQSFADLYIGSEKGGRHYEKAVRRGRHGNMGFVLGNSLADDRASPRRRPLSDGHFSNGRSRRAHVGFSHFR